MYRPVIAAVYCCEDDLNHGLPCSGICCPADDVISHFITIIIINHTRCGVEGKRFVLPVPYEKIKRPTSDGLTCFMPYETLKIFIWIPCVYICKLAFHFTHTYSNETRSS